MDVPQTSKYMNVAIDTLAGWRARGRGPAFIRAESKVLYDRDDVDAWFDANRTATNTAA
jgi:hypothetical protein